MMKIDIIAGCWKFRIPEKIELNCNEIIDVDNSNKCILWLKASKSKNLSLKSMLEAFLWTFGKWIQMNEYTNL